MLLGKIAAVKKSTKRVDALFISFLNTTLHVLNCFVDTSANPEAARRLGVNHVRGILFSGPPVSSFSFRLLHCIAAVIQKKKN